MYSNIVIPLTRLTRKDSPWLWSMPCEDAFQLLKTAFATAPILHHFDPSLLPVVETDASDYTIVGVLSLCAENSEIHPIGFYSCMLTGAELNYSTHDKELLAVFKVFKAWHHDLESLHHTIDIITDHKNLEYFSTTKTLSRQQARWSEYLSTFNMVICFRPGKLSEKPDSLTRHADFYLKRGDRDYTLVNPQNLHPIFTQAQLATSLRTTRLQEVVADAAALVDASIPILDISALLEDIKAGYAIDPLASRELSLCLQGSPSPHYSISTSGLLLLDSHVYVPDYQPK